MIVKAKFTYKVPADPPTITLTQLDPNTNLEIGKTTIDNPPEEWSASIVIHFKKKQPVSVMEEKAINWFEENKETGMYDIKLISIEPQPDMIYL